MKCHLGNTDKEVFLCVTNTVKIYNIFFLFQKITVLLGDG